MELYLFLKKHKENINMKESRKTITKLFLSGILTVCSLTAINAQTTAQGATEVETFKKQVEANPKDTQALANLASAYQNVQDWNNALATWKNISTLLPDWSPSYYSQAYVYQSLKDNANAKTAYEKYVSMVKPEEVEANKKNLAYAHFFIAYSEAESNKESAKAHLAKSLEFDPTNQEAADLSKILNQ